MMETGSDYSDSHVEWIHCWLQQVASYEPNDGITDMNVGVITNLYRLFTVAAI